MDKFVDGVIHPEDGQYAPDDKEHDVRPSRAKLRLTWIDPARSSSHSPNTSFRLHERGLIDPVSFAPRGGGAGCPVPGRRDWTTGSAGIEIFDVSPVGRRRRRVEPAADAGAARSGRLPLVGWRMDAGSVVGAAGHRRGDPAGDGWTSRWPSGWCSRWSPSAPWNRPASRRRPAGWSSGSSSTSSRAPPPEPLPQVALVGRLRQMTLRPDRGRGGRHEGALRLRLWRLPSGPPDGADRLLVPSRRVAAQGDRAYGSRVAPIPRHEE